MAGRNVWLFASREFEFEFEVEFEPCLMLSSFFIFLFSCSRLEVVWVARRCGASPERVFSLAGWGVLDGAGAVL